MAKRIRRAALLTVIPTSAAAGITAKGITHDTRFAMVIAGIVALVSLVALGLVLWAELAELRIKKADTLTRCALETARFQRSTSCSFLWWLFPKQAEARRKAAAEYKPLAIVSPEANSTETKNGAASQRSAAVKNGSPRRRTRPPVNRKSLPRATDDEPKADDPIE